MRRRFSIFAACFFTAFPVAFADADDRTTARVPGVMLANHQSEAHILGLSQKRFAIHIAIAATLGGAAGFLAGKSALGALMGALVVTGIDVIQVVVEAGLVDEVFDSYVAPDTLLQRSHEARTRTPALRLAAATVD